jgi:hypothetical protein
LKALKEQISYCEKKKKKNCIDDALYYFKSKINLISYKDIHLNGYYVETTNEGSDKNLYITSII